MKTPVFPLLLIGTAAFAQSFRGGINAQASRPFSLSGFGGTPYHGIGRIPLPGFGYGGFHHGYPNGGFYGHGYGRPFAAAYPIYWWPPIYPLFDDTFQGLSPQPPVQQLPMVIEQPAPGASVPRVIINQYFRSDEPPGPELEMRYSPASPTESPSAVPAQRTNGYLIALADEKIIPVLAYMVEGERLTYVTGDGLRNTVALSLVDKDLSQRLNQERGVRFNLP